MNTSYWSGVLVFIMCACFFFYGGQVTHRASEVEPGVFAAGTYIFPGTSRMGIGTTSAATPLDVSVGEGSEALRIKSGETMALAVRPQAGTQTVIDTGSRHLILNPGTSSVGIGTNTPSQKIHLASGTLRVDSSICFGTVCRTNWPTEGAEQFIAVAATGDYFCPVPKVVTGFSYDGAGDDHITGFFCK